MKYINKIKKEIKECEKSSDAEIVCVVSRNFLLKILNKTSIEILIFLTLLISFILAFCGLSSFKILEFQIVFYFFIIFFGKILNFFPKRVKILLSKYIANLHFRNFGFNRCSNSVMFFVFLDLRCAHIVVGKNILKEFDIKQFDFIISKFLIEAKSDLDLGIFNTIKEICKILKDYKNSKDNKDEIEKEFIILE